MIKENIRGTIEFLIGKFIFPTILFMITTTLIHYALFDFPIFRGLALTISIVWDSVMAGIHLYERWHKPYVTDMEWVNNNLDQVIKYRLEYYNNELFNTKFKLHYYRLIGSYRLFD